MYRCKIQCFIMASLCAFFVPGVASAASQSWGNWLQNQIEEHPEVMAARQKMKATLSLALGQERPLYNPELETEYEREGDDNNYRLGLSQTIDLWGKRDVRRQQAASMRIVARQEYELARQQKTAEALETLVQWQAAKEQAILAAAQEAQMETLLALVKDRQQAGDLGQLDAELAFLSLSQRLNETAQNQAELHQVEADLRELLPDWTPQMAAIPSEFWSAPVSRQLPAGHELESSPSVLAAKARWQAGQQAETLAKREAKADPTLGINGGDSGEESVVAFTLSIPLHFRNTYGAEVQAAGQEAAGARADYIATLRRQQFAVQAARQTLEEYEQRFGRYQEIMGGRGQSSEQLLEKQWRSGDMSTTEYLLAMEQRSEGLVAGIQLRSRFQASLIDWLLVTNQINAALQVQEPL